MGHESALQVVIVDDHQLVRQEIRAMLEGEKSGSGKVEHSEIRTPCRGNDPNPPRDRR